MEVSENRKITFVIGNMQRDGAERVISILAEYYCKKGWNVDILTLLNSRCNYEINTSINLIPICRENKPYYKNIAFWIKGIRKYVITKDPDRIVAFIARINIITLISCIGLKKTIIISERNDPMADGRNIFVKFATFVLYKFADTIVFQTRRAQSCFAKSIVNKSVVIPNPVRTLCYASKVKSKKIVAVGRLESQKNHLMLIDAFAKIKEKHREYELYIYGDGSLKNTIEQKVMELGINDSVHLPGNVVNVHEKIADAEIFVLPSNYEGLSNALLEALMMGIPCISTNCSGSDEVINDGINGLLVPVGDTYALANAIEKLIDDPELANCIGKNAKKSSILFDSENVLKYWGNVIEK